VEILEKKTKDDVIFEEEQEEAPKAKTVNINDLLDDDEVEEQDINHAKAEDDISEKSDNSDFDNILMVDPEEKVSMQRLMSRRKRKHKKIEKLQVDPEWLKEFIGKRQKTGELDGEDKLINSTQLTVDEEQMKKTLQPIVDSPSESISRSLLLDYLNNIKGLFGNLKKKMYILLIKLIHTTNVENHQEEQKPSQLTTLEELIIQFILNHDRLSFFDVMKFWVHYEYNKKISTGCLKFDVLFPHILNKIVSSKLFMMPNEWIEFIETLPTYPAIIFNHIYQVGLDSIHKDVAAIKLFSNILTSKCYKAIIKKDCIKFLLKSTIAINKVHMNKQAIQALLHAHNVGVFMVGKMDVLRNYLHDLLDQYFEKYSTIQETKIKIDVHKQLILLLYLIVTGKSPC
jgi:hypothetical protein